MTDKRPLCKNCGTRHGLAAAHAQTVTVGLGVTDNVTGRGVTRQMSRDNVTTPPMSRDNVTDLERRVVALEERVAALEKRRQTDADRQRKRRGSSNGRAAAP